MGNLRCQQLFPNWSEDVVNLNNIIVPRPGGTITSNNRNTGIRWDCNIYPTAQTVYAGANDIVADPGFIDRKPDPTKGDFRLSKTRCAVNSGSNGVSLPNDILGKACLKRAGRDRGTFEQ